MFGFDKAPVNVQEAVQKGMEAIAEKQEKLGARKENALSAFRNAAVELDAVNTGLQETVTIANRMAAFFQGQADDAEQAICDNNAVRDKILDIIGE